ncbi:MAG: hypothetical protein Q7K43_06400, partial [Candidatus Woesearchaeota archaeon]|nr:hypothetical protein [Candidatus Woesearchaeota archaeon]
MTNGITVSAPMQSLEGTLRNLNSSGDSSTLVALPSQEFSEKDVLDLARQLYQKYSPSYSDSGAPIPFEKSRSLSIEKVTHLAYDFYTSRKEKSLLSDAGVARRFDKFDAEVQGILDKFYSEEHARLVYEEIVTGCRKTLATMPSEAETVNSNIVAARLGLEREKEALGNNQYERLDREVRRLKTSKSIIEDAAIKYFGKVYDSLIETHPFWSWLQRT